MTAAQVAAPWTNEIESVAKALPAGQQEDWRRFATAVVRNLQAVAPGGNLVRPGGPAAGSSSPPPGGGLSVNGANATYQLTVQPPSGPNGVAVWHQVQYAPVASFSTGVTTMPASTATTVTVPKPGAQLFFRIRFSFDQTTWSGWTAASVSSVSSGLVSSGATSDAGAFNQTNFGVVTSTAVGSTAEVQISGPSGALTSLVGQKGPTQRVLPSGSVFGVAPGSEQYAAYDGEGYVLRPTLAGALSDDSLVPIGKVSVVETGVPVLPVVVPIISGGAVVGYNVTNQGNGITGPLDLVVSDPGGPGTGATTGTQTIEAGKLLSVAPGNAGQNYDGHTIVTASGGVNPGTPGGGTSAGGNGGRMTNV